MKGHEFKPKFSEQSGRGNLNARMQNPSSVSHASKVQNEQKPSAVNAKYKSSSSDFDKSRVVCYYCKKSGHITSNCTRRLAKQTSKEDSTVHLVSTFTSPHSEGLADSAVAPKPQEIDLHFKDHCCQVTLIGPRCSRRVICALSLGGCLLQEHDGVRHPVLYASRKLLPREQNYSVGEREFISVSGRSKDPNFDL